MTDTVERLRTWTDGNEPTAKEREAADEIERLTALHVAAAARAELAQIEIERLRAAGQRALDHYDMRSELYTSDADVATGMASILRAALEPKP